jgi:hypothetical protein
MQTIYEAERKIFKLFDELYKIPFFSIKIVFIAIAARTPDIIAQPPPTTSTILVLITYKPPPCHHFNTIALINEK